MLLKPNVVNQISKGTMIFREQEQVDYICMILKGRIAAENMGSRVLLSEGCMFGIHDLYMGRYLCNYSTATDVIIYAIPMNGIESIADIFSMNKDYHGVMVSSLCFIIRETYQGLNEIEKCDDAMYGFLQDSYSEYLELGNEFEMETVAMPQIEELEAYFSDTSIDQNVLDYFLECSSIPVSAVKEFYGYSAKIARDHLREASALLASLTLSCMEVSHHLRESLGLLMNEKEQGLFQQETALYIQLKKSGLFGGKLKALIESAKERVNSVDKVLSRYTNHGANVEKGLMEDIFSAVISGGEIAAKKASSDADQKLKSMMKSLKDSKEQILHYSGLEQDKLNQLSKALEYFVHVEDRFGGEEELRNNRKLITKLFYDLYENIFLLSYQNNKIPKAVELFLNFGFIDERLLTQEQLESLCKLKSSNANSPCMIYTIYEWLTLIYEGKREPSKSEFDQDYSDIIRHKRKLNQITDKEEKELLTDMNMRLEFEIKNMFAYNSRVVNGQISTFVPILCKEQFLIDIERAYLDKQTINEAFSRVLNLDYSAFYRESLYMNQEARIEKETVIREVLPEIIILPIAGSNGSMWQENSAKKRSNPGRFLFPYFIDSNLDDIMIKMFGRFRWELCRLIQGASWNDLKHKSLTSEYVDYIQFYRKNHDLSEERKEKLKLQIQKGRSNSREIFVLDYEAWMKGEVNGAIKLNKVAREILATYCPFKLEQRIKLSKQPIFAEAYARFHRNKTKKVHELELRAHNLKKQNITLTKEIEETMYFYKEL